MSKIRENDEKMKEAFETFLGKGENKNWQETQEYFNEKLKGKSQELINKVALESFQYKKIFDINKFLHARQEEMTKKGIKHHTFLWTLNTLRTGKMIRKKFGINVKLPLFESGASIKDLNIKDLWLLIISRIIIFFENQWKK